MADYWIKWYHEILDDPKMATLPDRLWRRFSEVCLLAGRLCPDKSGKLPDTRQLAWLLRMPSDELQIDLEQLTATGMVEPIPNGWLIVNFAKRQRAATSTERVRRHRENNQKQQYYADETDQKRNVTQINRLTETESETETEEEKSAPDFPIAPEIALYHEVTGLYPNIMDEDRVKQKIRDIRAKLHSPPVDVVKQIMLDKYGLWKSCTTKDGRPYNPSNPDWLDWCITDYAPKPTIAPPPPKMRKLTDAHGNVIEVPA